MLPAFCSIFWEGFLTEQKMLLHILITRKNPGQRGCIVRDSLILKLDNRLKNKV